MQEIFCLWFPAITRKGVRLFVTIEPHLRRPFLDLDRRVSAALLVLAFILLMLSPQALFASQVSLLHDSKGWHLMADGQRSPFLRQLRKSYYLLQSYWTEKN